MSALCACANNIEPEELLTASFVAFFHRCGKVREHEICSNLASQMKSSNQKVLKKKYIKKFKTLASDFKKIKPEISEIGKMFSKLSEHVTPDRVENYVKQQLSILRAICYETATDKEWHSARKSMKNILYASKLTDTNFYPELAKLNIAEDAIGQKHDREMYLRFQKNKFRKSVCSKDLKKAEKAVDKAKQKMIKAVGKLSVVQI